MGPFIAFVELEIRWHQSENQPDDQTGSSPESREHLPELVTRVNTQAAQNLLAASARGVGGDAELRGDLSVGASCRHQAGDLRLTWSQTEPREHLARDRKTSGEIELYEGDWNARGRCQQVNGPAQARGAIVDVFPFAWMRVASYRS